MELKEFSVTDVCGSNIVLDKEVREFEMKEGLVIQANSGINSYIVDDSLGNMVRIEVGYSKSFQM